MDLNIGKKLILQKNYKDAENIFINLLKKEENSLEINFFLGLINFELRKIKKSFFYYNQCLKIDSNSIKVLLNLANLEQSLGNIEKAREIYLEILKINKNIIRAYYGLFLLNPKYLENDFYTNLFEISKNINISQIDKFLSNFLLSKLEKNKKNYNSEIKYLEKAHQDCFKSRNEFNLQSQHYYNNIIYKYYNKIEFSKTSKKIYLNKLYPIFIIGLPRSGSTLTEAIITSADKKVFSFGESSIINMAVVNQIPKIYFNKKFNFEEKLKIDLNKFEEFIYKQYIQYEKFNDKNLIFLDKSLENFLNIEFILEVFPNAKFLHCKRDLRDSIVAIYQSLLPELSWTHNIEDIIIYIDNYLKIINFFKKKYSKRILDISLQKFTNNKEDVSKKIFEFCDLKWDTKILEFYNREDLEIRTTSNIQLRGKITKYDNNKYKKYYSLFQNFEKRYKWFFS